MSDSCANTTRSVTVNRTSYIVPIDSSKSSQSITVIKSKATINKCIGIGLIMLGTITCSSFGVITRLSMFGNETTPYESSSAVTVAEFGKFIISFLFLLKTEGIIQTFISLKSVPYQEWILFLVPAILYSITNNVDFLILRHMDPGSRDVLCQSKIVTTALLWRWWFNTSLTRQQWIALLLLCLGSMFTSYPNSTNKKDININSQNTMYVNWPIGPFYVLIQVSLSSIAGVYTEWVYKTFAKNRSIHIDNLSMYFWGIISNLIQFIYIQNNFNLFNLLNGFNHWTYILIIIYTSYGLIIAQIFKYYSHMV